MNVMLARVVAGRNTKRVAAGRQCAVSKTDVVRARRARSHYECRMGRKLPHGVSLGVEAVGEDLEGFWEAEEAEGGARLLAGPSLHISPASHRWQFTATGGPMFHPADTGRASGALRDLPPEISRTSYAFKAALSISLVSAP